MRGTIGYRLLSAMGLRQNQPGNDDRARSGIVRAPWFGRRVQDIKIKKRTKRVWIPDPHREWWERNKGTWKDVVVSEDVAPGHSRGSRTLAEAICNTLLARA